MQYISKLQLETWIPYPPKVNPTQTQIQLGYEIYNRFGSDRFQVWLLPYEVQVGLGAILGWTNRNAPYILEFVFYALEVFCTFNSKH